MGIYGIDCLSSFLILPSFFFNDIDIPERKCATKRMLSVGLIVEASGNTGDKLSVISRVEMMVSNLKEFRERLRDSPSSFIRARSTYVESLVPVKV